MKFNKQKIEELKEKARNVKEKISNKDKEKVPKKYYALLLLMLMLGVITVSNNLKQYNKSNQEEYREYNLNEQQVSNSEVEIANYKIAESSISTDIANMEEKEAIETISSNNKSGYIMPLSGDILKEFAVDKLVYSETLGMWKTHPGIDIKGDLGTEVKSSSDGIVQTIQQDGFYGNTVKILDSEGYTFVYSNLDGEISLKEGNSIKQGEIIGKIGVSAAGELADESHLHFEIIKDETQVNPVDLIN